MSIAACAEIVQKGDPERFRAAMALPIPARRILFPLYAFNVEVSRAPWVTAEPMIAEMRLQWWRDALDEIANASPVRKHPVTTPLADILDPQAATLLDQLIQARRWDIYRDPFDDAAHFVAYLNATAGHLTWVAGRALGSGTETAIRARANAAGFAAWIKATPQLLQQGRQPLLRNDPKTIANQASEALKTYQTARPDKAARQALLYTWATKPILKQIAHSPDAALNGHLGISDFQSRIRLLAQGLRT